MRFLNELVSGIEVKVKGDLQKEITGVTYDSREVKDGNVFVCLKGQHTDGNNFIESAIKQGAVSIVTENLYVNTPDNVTTIFVKDALKSLAIISARFYEYPSRKVYFIGVTGTNGKTTVTYLIDSILNEAGISTAIIGTINYRIKDKVFTAKNTTPLSSDLQCLLDMAVKSKVNTVIMEVSSHSLVLERVTGCEFDTGIFTNLTRDHLDFHKTFEEYFNAKLKLFKMLSEQDSKKNKKYAIVNIDDPYGKRIIDNVDVPVITYGIENPSDFTSIDIRMQHRQTDFILKTKDGSIAINTHLIGKHNIYNILSACACAWIRDIDLITMKRGIEKVRAIPGRLEKIESSKPFTVFVDYAHTPDALQNVLLTLKELRPSRIITVFGCGGNRDRTKRPLMGEISVNNSDYVIVTSDNPRDEDPGKIALDIEVGIKKTGKTNYEVILDREDAIKRAINIADKGDVILLAGKGHETYQILGGERIPFDDREVARKYLNDI